MSENRPSRSSAPIARLVARGLAQPRALVRKLVVGDVIGERLQVTPAMVARRDPPPPADGSAAPEAASEGSLPGDPTRREGK